MVEAVAVDRRNEEKYFVKKWLGVASIIAFSLFVAGCSEGGGRAVDPGNYTGDIVGDFVIALQAGDTEKVRELLKTDSTLAELRDETGQSPLHYAVLSNSVPLVELLIDEGIDPNVKDNEGRTPLTVLEDSNLRLDAARDALKDAGGTN
ncbi:MAG: ankyrin repeat domain-containing protein [Candidatus Hydrogenedentes bacterium]|nr:ankyrin repeat domain-containing protein [Candidatus Hydrogenedentota bacterium]